MNVTLEGQITIPPALMERFGLLPGTEIEFVAAEDGLKVKPMKRVDIEETDFERWLSLAAGSARSGVTTGQVMAMTRGED